MSRDDMFSRWSERRRRVAEAERAEEAPAPEPVAEVAEPETEEEETALLESLGLPRPEDVGPGDAAKFLQAHVPEFLRRRALRTLWKSHPTFAVLDGLNDYDDDFRSPELTQKVLATAYQVGKGILREVEIVASAPQEEPEPDEDDLPADEAFAEQSDGLGDAKADDVPIEEDAVVYAPRRMTFDT